MNRTIKAFLHSLLRAVLEVIEDAKLLKREREQQIYIRGYQFGALWGQQLGYQAGLQEGYQKAQSLYSRDWRNN